MVLLVQMGIKLVVPVPAIAGEIVVCDASWARNEWHAAQSGSTAQRQTLMRVTITPPPDLLSELGYCRWPLGNEVDRGDKEFEKPSPNQASETLQAWYHHHNWVSTPFLGLHWVQLKVRVSYAAC